MRKRAGRGTGWFREGSVGTAVLAAILFAGGTAHAGGGITGTWQGTYLCSPMAIGLELRLEEDGDGRITGESRAVPTATSFRVPGTVIPVIGHHDLRTGRVVIEADRAKMPRANAYPLHGVHTDHPATISGYVLGSGCAEFVVTPGPAPAFTGEPLRPQLTVRDPRAAAASGPPCDRVLDWARRVEAAYPEFQSAGNPALVAAIPNAFDDASFVPVFGAPFDRLGDDARSALAPRLAKCFEPGESIMELGPSVMRRTFLTPPFLQNYGALSGPHVAVAVQARRGLRAWAGDATRTLDRLAGGPTAYARAEELKAVGEELLVHLWPDERQAFLDRVESVRVSGAEPSLVARVDAALAAARGGTGAAALEGFETDNAALLAAVSEPVRARELARVSGARRSLLAEALSAGRGEWSAWGHDLEALGQEAAWYTGFRDRNAALFADPEVESLLDDFRARRAATLEGARPELERRLAEADTDGAVDRALAAYLVDDLDGPLPPSRPLYAAAQARRNTLQRERRQAEAAARRQAAEAARRREEERRQAAATVPAAPSPVGPGISAAGPGGSASGVGEGPSEREMIAAIEAEIEAKNAGIRDVESRCQSRGFAQQNDPITALMCLGTMGANGGKPGLAYRVTGFKRIACASALPVGKAGYLCDYYVSFSSNSPFQSRGMDMLQSGQARARFVRSGDGWLILRD